MVELKNVSFWYRENDSKLLDNVNLHLENNGLIIIKGISGSGKSTLLSLIRGDLLPKCGDILFNNQSLLLFSNERKKYYQLIENSFVYQECPFINDLSIKDNLMMLNSVIKEKRDEKYINILLKKVNLDKDIDTKVSVLSGGERQRLAIARAMFFNPSIILCDEPTSSLDSKNTIEIMNLLKELSKEVLVLVVTHDEEVEKYGDKVYLLEHGKLILTNNMNSEVKFVAKTKRKYTLIRPLKFIYTYLFNKIRQKPFKNIVVIMFLSIAFFIGGASSFILNSFKNEINSSLNGLTDDTLFQMNVVDEEKLHKESVNISLVKNICQNLDGYLGCGYYYDHNFKTMFETRNEMRIASLSTFPILKGFDLNSINEFEILDYCSYKVYPFINNLNNDEIILGLPSSQMKSIANLFNIYDPNYEKLGKFLSSTEIRIVLYLKNIEWDYENEEVFILKGVVQSNTPKIIHTNAEFNRYVIEDRMKLKYTSSWYEQVEYPWILRRRSVVYASKELSSILSKHPIYSTYLYDEYPFLDFNYYRFSISKSNNKYILINDVNKIIYSSSNIEGYLYGSDKGYPIISQSLIHRFKGYFCVSSNSSSIYNAENILSKDLTKLNLDDNVYINSIYFQNHKNNLAIIPIKDAIAVSSTLANNLGLKKGDNLEILFYDYGENNNFYKDTWIVEKIIKNDECALYLSNDVLINFLHQVVKYKSSFLKPKSILFKTNSNDEVINLLTKLSTNYPGYLFCSPSNEFIKSMNKSLSNIETGLLIFSIWLLVFSIILLSVIQELYIHEYNNDINLMIKLGMGKEINDEIEITVFKLISYIAMGISSFIFIAFILLSSIDAFNNLLPIKLHFNVEFFVKMIILYLLCYITIILKKVKKPFKILKK